MKSLSFHVPNQAFLSAHMSAFSLGDEVAPWGIGGEATKFTEGVGTKPHACKAKKTNKKIQKNQITSKQTQKLSSKNYKGSH